LIFKAPLPAKAIAAADHAYALASASLRPWAQAEWRLICLWHEAETALCPETPLL